MEIVIGITGASGAIYAVELLKRLQTRADVHTHLIVSPWGAKTLLQETGLPVEALSRLAHRCYDWQDLAAPISSGTFYHDGMVVLPCSMRSLAAVANGLSGDLISRAADVTLKEGRRLILCVRETPLSRIHLTNLLRAAEAGAVIMPPVNSFYFRPQTVEELVGYFVDRVLEKLGLPDSAAPSWEGLEP